MTQAFIKDCEQFLALRKKLMRFLCCEEAEVAIIAQALVDKHREGNAPAQVEDYQNQVHHRGDSWRKLHETVFVKVSGRETISFKEAVIRILEELGPCTAGQIHDVMRQRDWTYSRGVGHGYMYHTLAGLEKEGKIRGIAKAGQRPRYELVQSPSASTIESTSITASSPA